ncbi:MAG: hypothetical protein GWM81_02075, partial [Desulfobacterales bacterium]|nr:hypothetical protein [Desulfobacterales bacterium]
MGTDNRKSRKKPNVLEPLSNLFTRHPVGPLLLIGISFLITLLLFPNILLPVHSYKNGDIAERDIKAPRDFLVKDEAATAEKRQESVRSVLTVYDFDKALQLVRNLLDQRPHATPETRKTGTAAEPAFSVHDQIWEHKEAFEKTLGIEVSDEAYTILEKNNFSRTVENSIISLLRGVLH